MSFVCPAPAKINLALHVAPPRGDGLHPLESLVTFADIGDHLRVAAAEELSLAIEGPFAAPLEHDPAENLVLRAAKALAREAGLKAGARLVLHKALPIASGIGGGSADAAAALRVLDRLWGVRAAAADLARIAQGLGADIRVCLAARPALMRGIGEICEPATIPDLWAILVNPGEPAPTGAVYRAFDTMGAGRPFQAGEIAAALAQGELLEALFRCRNDLEAAALQIAPGIGTALAALRQDERVALARMSGSGATVFGLTRTEAQACAVAAALDGRPRWCVRAARLGAIDADPTAG